MSSTIEEKNLTPFNKKIHALLEEKGYKNVPDSSIAFIFDNLSDDVIIDINFMSTGIHFKKKNLDKKEIIEAGFRYCPTWSYSF